jgi:UDP-N-acetylmuramoyl-L-alanyl-D-glutamate--2,6-diaminopimelate ligase
MRHGFPHANFVSRIEHSESNDLQKNAHRSRSHSSPTLALFDGESDRPLRQQDLTPTTLSGILSPTRIIGADDMPIAEVSESCFATEGNLVLFRIGKDDPDQVIADALARGASGILTEQLLPCPLPQCIVADVELAAAMIERVRLGKPDTRVLTIAVMGSAGKTTTALLIAKLLRDQGLRTAYQCDLGSCDGVLQTTDTTLMSGGRQLLNFLDTAADTGAQVAILEIEETIAATGGYQCVEFDLMVVCGSARRPESYGTETLFAIADCLTPDGVVITPADDKDVLEATAVRNIPVVTYGLRDADVEIDIIDNSGGLMTMLLSHFDTMHVMESALTGEQNACNLAAAAAIGLLLDQPLHEIGESLGALRSVPGRDQRFASYDAPTVILDVAGNPKRAQQAIENYRRQEGVGRVWTILAIDPCDDQNLPGYGTLVERSADHMTLTSTGRNKSNFLSTAHQVMDGVKDCAACRLVADPAAALAWALSKAKPSDVVLVLTGNLGLTANQRRTDLRSWEDRIKTAIDELTIPATKTNLKLFNPEPEKD